MTYGPAHPLNDPAAWGHQSRWNGSDEGLRSQYANLAQRLRDCGLPWSIPLLPQYPYPRTFASMDVWREEVHRILSGMEDAIGAATYNRRNYIPTSALDHSATVKNVPPEKPKM
jgi:hypothetical protein